MATAQLTPVLTVNTAVPAPVSVVQDDGSLKVQASSDASVGLKVCSEFTSYTAPVTAFGGVSKLALIQDKDGQPMAFSIGNDNQLYCLRHVPGNYEVWQTYKISPVTTAGYTVQVYDVTQAITEKSNTMVIACVSADATLKWVTRSNKSGSSALSITALSCGGSTPKGQGIIALGTKATGSLLADNYTISALPENMDPAPVAPPQHYKSILQVAPGNLSAGFFQGTFTLFDMADGTVGGSFSNMDNSLTVQLDFDDLGVVHSLFSSPAPSGFTDLFAASDHGIAFFPQNTPDAAPQVVLPSISFKQVVVSQYDVNLVGLAVSTANELYYFEGTRAKNGSSSISWLASGLPIRADVLEISTQYNVASGSTELIYITNSDKTVKHLYLTPQSFLWQEHIIAVRPADGQPQSLTYAAHVTSIHPFSSVTGSSLGADYPLSISSEWAYVTINKSTYTLNTAEPISVVTDNSGSVNIVQRINDSIACPHYTVMLSQFGTTASVSVDPTQRISTQLPKYNTAASLQNATTTDGRPVKFPDTTNFDAAASVLDKFKTVQNTVSNTTVNALAVNNSTESFTLKENGVLEKDGGSWVTDVVTDIESFFGDVWETIKSGLSAGFKFAMNVLDGAVSILVSIAGKVFRFVITTMVGAIRSFAGFLKSALGIDITGFLDWLGFIFDIDKILETQVTVNKAIGSGIDFISYSVEALQPVIVQMFDTIKSQLEQWIPDTREVPPNTGETNFFTKLIGFIFDNPIVKLLGQFNPLGWVMKQADDIFGDVIQLPDLSGLIGVIMAAVGKTFDEEVANIVKLLSDVMQKFTSVFNGKTTAFTAIGQLLGDAFWTLLDAVKIIITNVVEVIPSIMAEFWKVLTSPIKLPIISTLWEAFVGSDTPLSFLNALTIIPSWVLNIYSGTVFGKMPFDPSAFGNPDEWFPSKDQVNTWLRPRSSPPMSFRASAMPKSKHLIASDSNSLVFASLDETPTNSETANEINGFQRVDLWLCIICPFVTSISSFIDAGCILVDANAARNAQANVNHGALGPPGTEHELRDINQPLLPAAAAQPASPVNTCLRIVRGIISISLFLPCVYNICIAAHHSPVNAPEFTVKVIGVVMQAVRLINVADPTLVWPGYVGDIGVMLQFGVGYALSDTAGDDPLAVGSALTTSLSAIWCCLGRLTVKYEPEFAAAFGILSAEYDVLNAIFCAQILNAADKSSISRSTDQLLTTLARVKNGASQHPSRVVLFDENRSSHKAYPLYLTEEEKGNKHNLIMAMVNLTTIPYQPRGLLIRAMMRLCLFTFSPQPLRRPSCYPLCVASLSHIRDYPIVDELTRFIDTVLRPMQRETLPKNYMRMMAEIVVEAMDAEKPLVLGGLLDDQPYSYCGIFVPEDMEGDEEQKGYEDDDTVLFDGRNDDSDASSHTSYHHIESDSVSEGDFEEESEGSSESEDDDIVRYVFTSSKPRKESSETLYPNDIDKHVSIAVAGSDLESADFHDEPGPELLIQRWVNGLCCFRGHSRRSIVFPWHPALREESRI